MSHDRRNETKDDGELAEERARGAGERGGGERCHGELLRAGGKGRGRLQPTDEQVGRAITAINGQILNNYQRWFGVVHYLSTMCGWPSNPMECCERINRLPGHEKWALACKYENIRKFPSDKYGRIPYSEWDEYKPKDGERHFLEFRDVARSFDEQLKVEMQK